MRSMILFSAAFLTVLLAGIAHTQDKKQPPPAPPDIAPTEAKTPAEELKTFHLPPHFEIQLVACEPDIHKPINMNFDDRGRLWVTESVEYPFAVEGNRKPRDAVKILEDFAADGKAQKITTFADGLNIPIGVLPLSSRKPEDALVFSIPNIYRLRDTKGTDHADQRDKLIGEISHDDTHGMTNAFTLGFDGWVYADHGFRNASTVKGLDGQAIMMQSGNVYRFRTDGSHVEQITHGQVNPFGLCFDPLGYLYSCDCHSQPIYQLMRGGYYPSFGKGHDGLGFAPEMYSNYQDSTAIAGIAYYAADHFPKEYRDSCYIGDVVTNRVNEFRFKWTGSSPRGELKYFLKNDDQWFRPVDIKLGPDGALYVADFYNRIIGHYEVDLHHPGRDRERGRIWRIIYKGEDGKNPLQAPRADWTTASNDELIKDLAHPNLTVRLKATNQLIERGGDEGAAALKKLLDGKDATVWQRVHGLWVLERTNKLETALLAVAVKHADMAVRVHAQRILGQRGKFSDAERELVLGGLKDESPHVQRAATDALAMHPAAENIRPLLDLRATTRPEDTHLVHGVRIALRNQLLLPATWAHLPSLDKKDETNIADVSLGVPSAESAAFLLEHIRQGNADARRLQDFMHHIARHGDNETTKRLLPVVRAFNGNHLQEAGLFRAIERGAQERGKGLDEETKEWAAKLTDELLLSTKAPELQAGIEIAGLLKLDRHLDRLTELATTNKTPDQTRNAALSALVGIDARKYAGTVGKVLTDAEASLGVRENASNLLARANQPETQTQLLLALPTAPARLQNVIAAGLAGSKTGADKLLDAIATGKASPRLLQEKAVESKLLQHNVPEMKERIGTLTKGLPKADEKLQALLKTRRDGFLKATPDATRGQPIFEKNCAICHQLGGKGAKVGPQLDGIGLRGLERLLEDTLDPNRNVDQAFRTTILDLKNGQTLSGLLLNEEGEVLVLADAQGKEVRVPKNTVDEKRISPLSPMPADFVDKIPEKEFYDLIAYLLAQRASGK